MKEIWILIIWVMVKEVAPLSMAPDHGHYLTNATGPVKSILESTFQPDCSGIILTDDTTSFFSATLAKNVNRDGARKGIGVFDVSSEDLRNTNETSVTFALDEILQKTIPVARKIRKSSVCVLVTVMSEDPIFLTFFAEWALQRRLLVWDSKLLVVTNLQPAFLQRLMEQYWTYSMMNTMFLNLERNTSLRWNSYTYLPFSPEETGILKVATWTESNGLQIYLGQTLFPDKYRNFHGGIVNVANLPYPPYWIEENYTRVDGTIDKVYTGMDGRLWSAVAQALNFTYLVLPAETWDEVLKQVETRRAFISPSVWDMLPERIEHHDMTYVYHWLFNSFCMKSPSLEHQWQSIYYPLANEVWLAILLCLLIIPGFLFMISTLQKGEDVRGKYGPDMAALEILGTFLGENVARLPTSNSGRTLMAAWLVFSFIIGAGYSSNLKANLTLPKYPPRVETLENLVNAVDIVMGAAYFAPSKEFFGKSDNEAYKKLSDLMVISNDPVDWMMEQAFQNNRIAVIDSLKHIEGVIADKYTLPDGSESMYIGRSSITPGPSIWLVPQDAPFTANFNKYMQAVLEAGLYDKWSRDELDKTQRKSLRRQREYLARLSKGELDETDQSDINRGSGDSIGALSLTHMQGAFFLLLMGLVLGVFAFGMEMRKIK